MSGLFGLGQGYRQQANFGLQRSSELEQQRATAQDQLKAAEDQAKGQMIGTGAAVGASVGLGSAAAGAKFGAAAGPVGALIGAGIGFLVSELF